MEVLRNISKKFHHKWKTNLLSIHPPLEQGWTFDYLYLGPCSSSGVIPEGVHWLFYTTWASYQIRKIAGCACAGNAGNISPRRRFQREALVSNPGMHHGTCVTHVPWCMSGSLTRSDGENVPGIPSACATAILRIWQEVHGWHGWGGPYHLDHHLPKAATPLKPTIWRTDQEPCIRWSRLACRLLDTCIPMTEPDTGPW